MHKEENEMVRKWQTWELKNMACKQVQAYIYKQISHIFSLCEGSFLKKRMNTVMLHIEGILDYLIAEHHSY